MPEALALNVSGLTVRYGDTAAVDDLDLTIPAGQTVALLGPNGAGKSTIVNAVLGLVRPVSGRIRVLDRTPQEAARGPGAARSGGPRGRAPSLPTAGGWPPTPSSASSPTDRHRPGPPPAMMSA